jgi:class I fructose-bisphosphate aldolase
MSSKRIVELLGKDADSLLSYKAKGFPTSALHLPGPNFVDDVFANTDRSSVVLRNFSSLLNHGRLAGTGYMSILPVDQGIEHSAAASFAPNPIYFDPENIVKLAVEGGCNAVCSTLGVLSQVSRKYAHKIPMMLKLNHNETLSLPAKHDQVMFASVKQAFEMGCISVGATVYWGAPESTRQLQEVSQAFAHAHELGLVTVLWCYTRNNAFKKDGVDYHTSGDLSGQAIHLGSTIGADIIKQKLPTNNGGFKAVNFSKTHDKVYSELCPGNDNPIELTRYQLANAFMGRAPLINSGGESKGANDMQEAAFTAVVNKRAGGAGLICGRKAFQRPLKEGIELLNLIQDVYLSKDVTIA